MFFSIHDFVMKTLRGMKDQYPEFQVREYALNWYSKGVLTEEDLEEVDSWYIEPEPEPEEEIPTEETPEEIEETEVNE